jgi:predicted ABC-type ATPase
LFYFWLRNVDLAISRVAARVKKGDHHIPEATIRRRYTRSLRNLFELYLPVVTSWKVYDNSAERSTRLVAEGLRGRPDVIYLDDVWSQIRSEVDG